MPYCTNGSRGGQCHTVTSCRIQHQCHVQAGSIHQFTISQWRAGDGPAAVHANQCKQSNSEGSQLGWFPACSSCTAINISFVYTCLIIFSDRGFTYCYIKPDR